MLKKSLMACVAMYDRVRKKLEAGLSCLFCPLGPPLVTPKPRGRGPDSEEERETEETRPGPEFSWR